MGELVGPEHIIFIALFIIPGFVAIKVYDLFVPSERRRLSESVIDLIGYSGMNFALAFVPFRAAYRAGVLTDGSWGSVLILVLGLLGLPATLAYLWVRLRRSAYLRGRVLHPTPTGWDYFFGTGRRCWLLFHLKSGRRLGAFYGADSFASSYPQAQQVYVEELWTIDDTGRFIDAVQGSDGAIISLDECELIEIFRQD